MSGYTIVSLCQDTQLCLGLLLFKHFSFFSFFKAFSFYFLFSIIEIFQMPSTENYIQVQNSVVCLEGTLLCPAVKLCQDTQLCHCVRIHNCVLVFYCCSNIFHFLKLFPFTFYFPSLKFSRCLPQKITSRYKIVWFVWRVHYCVQLLSWGHDFFVFFQSFPLPFPLLAKVFSFQLISFLVSFIWNSQKWPVSQNILCLIKTQLKNITQTIFQGGSPWATLIHNSVVCLRVHYCVQLLPEVMIFWFFQSFPLPFPLLAKVFSF